MLQLVTVGYTSGGIMNEELITFAMLYGLPNDSIRISDRTHRDYCTGCYHFATLLSMIREQHRFLDTL